jgi:hypothetical protein
VRDRQVEHASVMIGRLSFGIWLLDDLRHGAGADGVAALADREPETLF